MGMVNAVVPADKLDEEVDKWCAEIRDKSPTAIAIAKRSFNADSENLRAIGALGFEALALFYGTEESKEGGRAFREKRPPKFRDKKEVSASRVGEGAKRRAHVCLARGVPRGHRRAKRRASCGRLRRVRGFAHPRRTRSRSDDVTGGGREAQHPADSHHPRRQPAAAGRSDGALCGQRARRETAAAAAHSGRRYRPPASRVRHRCRQRWRVRQGDAEYDGFRRVVVLRLSSSRRLRAARGAGQEGPRCLDLRQQGTPGVRRVLRRRGERRRERSPAGGSPAPRSSTASLAPAR